MSEAWSQKDRRKSERIQKHGPAEVKRTGDGETFEKVQIMNVSEGGVRFVTSAPFEGGELCTLRHNGEEKAVKVHHCKELFSGYAIRGEYVD
jgi:hypothetical protein